MEEGKKKKRKNKKEEGRGERGSCRSHGEGTTPDLYGHAIEHGDGRSAPSRALR